MEEEPHTGGVPEAVAQCADCGRVYPVQKTEDGTLRPVGTAGSCECGNDEFEPHSGTSLTPPGNPFIEELS